MYGRLNLGWTRRGEPVNDDLLKFLGGHPCMGRHDQFRHPVLARLGERFHVTFKRRLEWLRVLPFWMERSQCLHAIERKSQLGVHRMFHPQGAIIIERCNALGGRHKIRRTLLRHGGNEIQDRLLFVAPSFHDGSVPPDAEVCARADMGRSNPDTGSTARAESSARRLTPEEEGSGDMAHSLFGASIRTPSPDSPRFYVFQEGQLY